MPACEKVTTIPRISNCYEVLAIKYASVERQRGSNFLDPAGGDPLTPMPLDFYVWLVRGHGQLLLVDTGFSEVSAIARKRAFLQSPMEALEHLGIRATEILDIAITHLHYDHAGNINQFPNAKVWLQQREMAYATGKCMCDAKQNHFFTLDDISVVLKRLYEGSVNLVEGIYAFAPGIEFHRIGGHTDGLQVVRVMTEKGWVVLASDAAHYYENLETNNPFPAISNREEMMEGFETIRHLSDAPENIVPGHDPLVSIRFPSAGVAGIAAFQIA